MFYKMFLLLFTTLIASAYTEKCIGIVFSNKCYGVDILKEGVNNIHQLALNDNDNTLYFTFDQIAKIPMRGLGFFNLDTKATGVIDGVRNATGVAIDQRRNRIYVGGADGLFFLNDNKVPEQLPVQDNIHYLFFKDIVYYVNRRREAYRFDYGMVTPLDEVKGITVDKLIIDDEYNMFFLQNRKLSRVKLGTRAVNTHERYTVDAITTDFKYKPYISTTNGVYVYNKYKYALDKVSNIVDLRELVFNRQGEPIYVVVDNIVKLNNPIPYIRD
ncbi:ommochrome-binding protein [Helicoverpa armigera]|uniref:ommochrome-binding protein n=1 Tax=Helicoverpa armigera TaxID=29058 RepID=UPI003082A729